MARADSGGGGEGKIRIFPSVIFKNVFHVYKFSIISNIFDSALGRCNRKYANKIKMHHILQGTQN